jgi:hypothetical protein
MDELPARGSARRRCADVLHGGYFYYVKTMVYMRYLMSFIFIEKTAFAKTMRDLAAPHRRP